jgi:LytS/YehU family sensor histidine kinase
MSYKSGYQARFEAGRARGIEEGAKKGVAKAHEAAQAGNAWHFYSTSACGGLIFGILVGVVVQYIILVACRLSERLPQVMMFAFIPAITKSLCYTIFERRCRLMLELDEELRKVQATRNLHIAQLQAVHDAVKRRIAAASSVEELTHARLVELANKEFAKIVTAAGEAHQVRSTQQPVVSAARNACTCPHCGNRIMFKDQAANKTVKCPYQNCGRPFRLPSPTCNSSDSPPITKR